MRRSSSAWLLIFLQKPMIPKIIKEGEDHMKGDQIFLARTSHPSGPGDLSKVTYFATIMGTENILKKSTLFARQYTSQMAETRNRPDAVIITVYNNFPHSRRRS